MSFPRFSLSSFVTLFSFQGTIFILILNSNKFACSSLFLRRRRVHRYARLRKNAKCAWNCLNWWRWGESNSWPPACKAGALPAELHPQIYYWTNPFKWWAQMDSNHRPHAYQACALTTWAMRPFLSSFKIEQYRFKNLWASSSYERCSHRSFSSLERRWSSRTFRYGYLVTT